MVINENGHSGIYFQSTKSHECIGAIVVGKNRIRFERLQEKYKHLNRRNGPKIAKEPSTDPADRELLISIHDFLRYAGKKKSVVDEESRKLLIEAGINPNLSSYGTEHFDALQSVLDRWEMRIIYFERDCGRVGRMLEWAGKIPHKSTIAIAHYRGKYDLLQSTHSLFKKPFCNRCLKAQSKTIHRCAYTCRLCGSQDLDDCNNPATLATIVCAECNVHFTSRSCYDRHLAGSTNGLGNRCGRIRVCSKCGRTWNKDYTPQHDCERGNWETVQALPGDTFTEHFVNLLVLRWTCFDCYGKADSYDCANCGSEREEIFKWETKGNDQEKIIRRFLKFVLEDPRMHNRLLIAHNGAKYDHHFLVDELTAMGVRTRYTVDSTAIISIHTDDPRSIYNTVTFKDSYKLITCALSEFPKTLGLTCGEKGVFPWKMNNPKFYGHKQRGLPPKWFYGVMSDKKLKEYKEFKAEVDANPDFIFDFDKSLVEYCRQDVRVLLDGVVKFDRLLTELTGWSPFVNCCTLASFTLYVFRFNYARSEDYVYLPETGWGGGHIRQSEVGLKWLHWIEEKLTYRIQHAGRVGGERCLMAGGKRYFVDGYDESTNTIYEFLGCYWHGCRRCYKAGGIEINQNNGFKMSQLRANTEARLDALRAEGFNVVSVWECNITRPEDPSDEEIIKMKKFFETCDVAAMLRLRPREPLAGGRCETWRYHATAEEGETIHYLDITSLYPSQMFFREFPVGEPQIRDSFTPEEVATLPFRGFIKAAILPPKRLLKPVLPYRCQNRLLFPTCGKCAREQNKDECRHTDDERKLVSSWTDIEVKKSISLGYRVIELYEVWNWPANQWKKDVYSDYIRLFYKIKLCASGWPDHLESTAEREEYLQWHRDNMGMTIEYDEIVENKSLRFVSKLILNSLWGKMAQRDIQRTKEILDAKEHAELLLDTSRETLLWRGIHDKFYVVHKQINEERHSSRYASLSHSSFVCAYGRLQLYELMEKVGERLLYNDTDSLIFKCEKGDQNPLAHLVTGYLGQLTSEVPEGKRIKEVILNAPKSYSIRYADGTQDFKSKGIQQTEATTALTFENLQKIVKSNFDGEPITMKLPQSTIARPDLGRIETRDFEKILRHANYKTAVEGDTIDTAVNRPFGYF